MDSKTWQDGLRLSCSLTLARRRDVNANFAERFHGETGLVAIHAHAPDEAISKIAGMVEDGRGCQSFSEEELQLNQRKRDLDDADR